MKEDVFQQAIYSIYRVIELTTDEDEIETLNSAIELISNIQDSNTYEITEQY